MRNQAIGLIEMPNLVDAVEALDIMFKTSGIRLLTWEKTQGGRLVTWVVQGELSSVQAAVDSALRQASGKIVASAVIPSPHDEVMKIIAKSASKYGKKNVFGVELAKS